MRKLSVTFALAAGIALLGMTSVAEAGICIPPILCIGSTEFCSHCPLRRSPDQSLTSLSDPTILLIGGRSYSVSKIHISQEMSGSALIRAWKDEEVVVDEYADLSSVGILSELETIAVPLSEWVQQHTDSQ